MYPVLVTRHEVCIIIGFIEHLNLISTLNYNRFTDLHALQITVTAAQLKSSTSSLVVA
jgi:hypothetical protein